MATPAPAWSKGPPPSLIPIAPPAPLLTPLLPAPARAKAGRSHHHLLPQDSQVHGYQLGLAQQLAGMARQVGMDVPTYQFQMALNMGVDPAVLNLPLEQGMARFDLGQIPLGLTLLRDDWAYTHLELVLKYPHVAMINWMPIDLDPKKGAFLLATCVERQVHDSIKYGHWMIPGEGAPALNATFAELNGIGNVFVLMASTDTQAFSGIAQMVGPAVPYDSPNSRMLNQHRVPLRWIYCKNIRFSFMNHVSLKTTNKEAEEARRLHGGLQPMKLFDGTRALRMFHECPPGVSVLMDFKYYDEAEANGTPAESGAAAIRNSLRAAQYPQQQNGGRFLNRPGYAPRQQYQNVSGGPGDMILPPPPPPVNPRAPRDASVAAAVAPLPLMTGEVRQNFQKSPSNGGARGGMGGGGANQAAPSSGGAPAMGGKRFSNNNNRAFVAPAPPRKIETADGARLQLQEKFVFEPTVKVKQKTLKEEMRKAQLEAEQMQYEDNAVVVEQEGGEDAQMEGVRPEKAEEQAEPLAAAAE